MQCGHAKLYTLRYNVTNVVIYTYYKVAIHYACYKVAVYKLVIALLYNTLNIVTLYAYYDVSIRYANYNVIVYISCNVTTIYYNGTLSAYYTLSEKRVL